MEGLQQPQVTFESLPNELLQHIFQHCDLQTLINVSQTGLRYSRAVHQLSRNDVFLQVICQNTRKCVVKLVDMDTSTMLRWDITIYYRTGCTIKLINCANGGRTISYRGRHRNLDLCKAAFKIAGKILSTPMFSVKSVEFFLRDDITDVCFESPVQYKVRKIHIYNCKNEVIKRIAENFTMPPKILILNHYQGFSLDEIRDLGRTFPNHGIEEVYFGIFPDFTNAGMYTETSEYRDGEGSWSPFGFQRFLAWFQEYRKWSTQSKHIGFWFARDYRNQQQNRLPQTERQIERCGDRLRIVHYPDHIEGFFIREDQRGIL